MGKSKLIKIILTVIYLTGVVFTIYYGIKYCLHSTYVSNPDAMLPFMEYERAFILMAVGFPFMLASTISVIRAWHLKKARHSRLKIVLVSLPAIVDAVPFVVGVGFILFLLVEGYLEAFGILG